MNEPDLLDWLDRAIEGAGRSSIEVPPDILQSIGDELRRLQRTASAVEEMVAGARTEALEEAALELEEWTKALAVEERAIVRIGANLIRKLKDKRNT